MRLFAFLVCFGAVNFCFGQSKTTAIEKDTLIPFNGSNSLITFGDERRTIPFDSKIPLYVCIYYKDSRKIHYEYFRMDTSRYLVREYFRNANINDNEGIKSTGVKVVRNQLARDTILYKSFDANQDETDVTQMTWYKEFSKEGEWKEYEDSTYNAIWWKGNYKKNKRIGMWTKSIDIAGKTLVLEEINYDIGPTKTIYTKNLIPNTPLDSLKTLLAGRWSLENCDDFSTKRMFYDKCQKLNGVYDCNGGYYQFFASNEFMRDCPRNCNKSVEAPTKGIWKIIEQNGQRIIRVTFTAGQIWKFKILYFDKDMQFVTERI